MNIVILDAHPMDAGDLDWTPLRALGRLSLHAQTSPEQVTERIAHAEVVCTNKVPLDRMVFAAAAPHLKLVSVLATGYNIVDVSAARDHGVTVCNVPGYSTPSVAQTTIALLLEMTNRAGEHTAAVRAGAWTQAGTWSFWNGPLVELAGKTLVVVGLGAIGRQVAGIAAALGMKVVAAQLPDRPASDSAYPRVSLDEAFSLADVITLHCPLTPQTQQLVNAERLTRMKPSAFPLNTSRGPLVDEAAVTAALQAGRLAGYAADVLTIEPPAPDNPLLSAPNCLVTPHLGWASRESRQRLLDATVENVKAFIDGKPWNLV